ncbi:MAG: SDR family oxidoreductase [Candidatus Heimdallarchaeota archaeon]|nr:SDR family oxidoreductase [Candidatus Heimdallarchaeota archaeon]
MKVVITGSSKGIGLAYAKEFLEHGDEVVISSRRESAINEALEKIKQEIPGSNIYGTTCDVTNPEDIKELIKFSTSKLSNIDIWINNAGTNGYIYDKLVNVPDETIKQVVETNLLGTLYTCKQVIMFMEEQGYGHIFNLSGYGSNGKASNNLAVYGATKSSIPQLNKTLRTEIENKKIGVHSISPGMVMTDLLTHTTTPEAKNIFNILAELPEVVAAKLVPKIRKTKGTGKDISFLSTLGVLWRFMTAGRRKNKFYDEEGNLKI